MTVAVPVLERPPVDWERHRGNGSPKILPPPGETWRNERGRKIGHRYYTRVTTYADALSEQYNLTAWKLRRLALGMGRRSDYVRLAAALTDGDHDRDALDELCAKALEAAGPNAADLGTALHSLTERVDYGEELGEIPAEIVPDLTAYQLVTDGTLRHLHREVRTVCDALECAGTPDAISVVTEQPPTDRGPACDCPPGRPRVVDTKTGSIRYPGKMSTQLAIYSRSARYDPETGERTPLDACPHWGVIVHVPVETGRAALFWLDLEHGWRGAELCGPVRQWRRAKADDLLIPFSTVAPVEVRDGGEVVRVEPRLASTNTKAPAAPTELAEPTELTLETPRGPHEAPEPEDDRESEDAADLEGTDEVPEPCDVRVVNTESPGDEPMHWCATHDSMWPHEQEVDEPATLPTTKLGSIPEADPVRAAFAAAGAGTGPLPGDDMPAPVRNPLKVRCGTTELLVEQCACPAHRPDLARVDDSGVEPDDGPTEIEPDGIDEGRDEWAARLLPDPVREAITRCVTARDLELLSSREWRSWGPEHRALAAEVHERLEAAERAAKPRAAFEAAVAAAMSRGELAEIAAAVEGQPWAGDAWPLLDQRWRELAGS